MYSSHDIAATDFPLNVGHKATNLHRLTRMSGQGGFHVPSAFVVGPDLLQATLQSCTGLTADQLDAEFRRLLESTSGDIESRWFQTLSIADLDPAHAEPLSRDYESLCDQSGTDLVVVRSSFEDEDGFSGSFAGVFDTIINVSGPAKLQRAVSAVLASVFSPRAMAYLRSVGCPQGLPRMSVIVQEMVGGRGWQGGVAFSTAPDLGSPDVLLVSAAEHCQSVTAGSACPEEFFVDKRALLLDRDPTIQSTPGTHSLEDRFSLHPNALRHHAKAFSFLEEQFGCALDIEWSSDPQHRLYVLQARPDKARLCSPASHSIADGSGSLVTGRAVGTGRVTGIARVVNTLHEDHHLSIDDILITAHTDPDWDPLLTQVGAVITEDGGRGSHTSVRARERGMLALVGAEGATRLIKHGTPITLLCEDGLAGAIYPADSAPAIGSGIPESEELDLPNPYQAFSLARQTRPQSVRIQLGSWITRFAPTRTPVARRTAYSRGYGDYESFLASRLADGISLARVAFPTSNLRVSLTEEFNQGFSELPAVLSTAIEMVHERSGTYPEVLPQT